MSSLVNQVTQPFGVKLFGGSNYPDRGLGDQALNASAPLQATGQNLLRMGSSALPNLYAEYADATGIANPYAAPGNLQGQDGPTTVGGQPGYIQNGLPFTGTPPASSSPGSAGSMELTGPWLSAYNNAASGVNARRKAAIEAARSSNTARGLSRSGATALEQEINKLHDDELNTLYSQHLGAAHQEKIGAIGQLLGGANQNIAQGASLIGGNVGTLEQQAQAATQRTNQGNAALGSTLGAAFGASTPAVHLPTTQPYLGGTTGAAAARTPSFPSYTLGDLSPADQASALGGATWNWSGF
jgi:hypothetical protein